MMIFMSLSLLVSLMLLWFWMVIFASHFAKDGGAPRTWNKCSTVRECKRTMISLCLGLYFWDIYTKPNIEKPVNHKNANIESTILALLGGPAVLLLLFFEDTISARRINPASKIRIQVSYLSWSFVELKFKTLYVKNKNLITEILN